MLTTPFWRGLVIGTGIGCTAMVYDLQHEIMWPIVWLTGLMLGCHWIIKRWEG